MEGGIEAINEGSPFLKINKSEGLLFSSTTLIAASIYRIRKPLLGGGSLPTPARLHGWRGIVPPIVE
jgi:hypothetical protein